MNSKLILTISSLTIFFCFQEAKSQEVKNFPFDPFVILKSWNYDVLIKTMGNGEEVMAGSKNQTYLAGLRYPGDLLGMHGKLEFSFVKDSISRIQFRQEHEVRVTSADIAGSKIRDPAVSDENKRAVQQLDSLQQRDSLSRDSVVRAISGILGPPLSNSRTGVTEKKARHSAIWINRGYSCLYKDYIDYSEVVFALSTVPLWAVGEFDIPAGTQILQKTLVSTMKMSWSASLLGFPLNASGMVFSDVFLLLEFTTGQRYLASVPQNSSGFLPSLFFEDVNGDAIPEAWIQVPDDIKGRQTRHYIFSLQFREPDLIVSSEDLLPAAISIQDRYKIAVNFQDGTTRSAEFPKQGAAPGQTWQLEPKGFTYLRPTKLNTDGSANFIGGIELFQQPDYMSIGILEIIYRHSPVGWEPDQIKLLPINK